MEVDIGTAPVANSRSSTTLSRLECIPANKFTDKKQIPGSINIYDVFEC